MFPKIPFQEILQALEGYENVVFHSCPELLANYYHPAEINLINRLTYLAGLFASVENTIKKDENIRCRYTRSLFKGIQEAILVYKQEIRKLEGDLVDPSLSLTAFIRMERFAWTMEKIKYLLEISSSQELKNVLENIQKHSTSSDPVTRQFFGIIRRYAFRPLFDDIWYCLMHGYLLDRSSSKFFIQTSSKTTLCLAMDKVPAFLSEEVVNKIYFCCKAVQSFKRPGNYQ